ncbi:30214_t:CDS:2 [Gigaspora margarita]|uniref:30214_t:CDS:1 n=1 Tax=Gigaspora margarita TaxID=4874 RepID=A0ABM8VYQ1_GIGMA|nr:30214_t:CDS:2 [Gigaspora margarita]
MTQDLFDSITDKPEFLLASSSGSTNISTSPEIKCVEAMDDKPKSPEIIEIVDNDPDLLVNDKLELYLDEPKTNLAEFLQLLDIMDYYYPEQIRFMNALSYPAMIPPIDIMENRPDIYKKWTINPEPEPETQAFTPKPINKNTSTSEIEDIYNLYGTKKSDKDDSAKSTKKRLTPSRLAKQDIEAILFAEQLKAGIKKVNSHYHIGSTTIKKIWASSNPYEHANSIEIDIPEKPDITKPDPIEEKRKRKTAEIERIAKNIFRSELGKLVQADD